MTAWAGGLSGSVRETSAILTTVTVWGEIDVASAARFRELLDQAVAGRSDCVAVDMAGVEFMDGRGLTVLSDAADMLSSRGRRLAVCSVPARVRWLFELTGLTESLGVEAPPVDAGLVPEMTAVASIPFTRDVLDAALKLVVTMAKSVVSGADGASVTLPRHGRLGTVAASNDVVLEMDHDQYDTGEGPCLDAATQGNRFHIASLHAEERWPAFVPRALSRGIQSIMSTPLIAGDRAIGALNIYSRAVGAFAGHEQEWADQFAAEAARLVTSADLGPSVELLKDQIQEALRSREVIALAQGMLMQRDAVSAAVAYSSLRQISRRTGQPLRDVCQDVVDIAATRIALDGSADERAAAT